MDEMKVENFGDINLDEITLSEAKATLKKFLEREDSLKEKAEEMSQFVAQKSAESDDYKDKWIRCAADFDNYKKRNAEVRKNAYDEGKIEVVSKILSMGDNLERALKLELDSKTREGVEMIYKNFIEVLNGMNVKSISAEGEVFDPNFHNCVLQEENDDETLSGKVKDEFLKGYKLNEKVIRYSSVRVYK